MTEITFTLGSKDATYTETAPRVPVDKRELARLLLDWLLRGLEKNDVQAQ